MKRRWIWLAGTGLLVAAALGIWVLGGGPPSSSAPPAPAASASNDDASPPEAVAEPEASAPTSPADPTAPATPRPAPQTESREPETADAPAPAPLEAPEPGTLVIAIDGEPRGRDTFAFTELEDGGLEVVSEGEFKFNLGFVPLSAGYRQVLRWNASLEPVDYRIELNGPMGFGNRTTEIGFADGRAAFRSGDERRSVELSTDNLVVVNMFSAYALVPEALARMDAGHLTALDAGGVGGGGENAESGTYLRTVPLRIAPLPEAVLQSDGRRLTVRRYELRLDGPQGGYQLLFDGDRFLGVLGEGRDGTTFQAYREEDFPDGFELVEG